MTANDYKHIFATVLPPSVDDAPICGATLDREWQGRGKPECPACNAKREELLADLRLTIGHRSMVLAEWARLSGVPAATIRARLHRGWPTERLLEPVGV